MHVACGRVLIWLCLFLFVVFVVTFCVNTVSRRNSLLSLHQRRLFSCPYTCPLNPFFHLLLILCFRLPVPSQFLCCLLTYLDVRLLRFHLPASSSHISRVFPSPPLLLSIFHRFFPSFCSFPLFRSFIFLLPFSRSSFAFLLSSSTPCRAKASDLNTQISISTLPFPSPCTLMIDPSTIKFSLSCDKTSASRT